MDKKALVAYFSCSGVTEKLAKTLSEIVEGDLFEIIPEVLYTSADLNWMDKKARSTVEMHDPSFRPAIGSRMEDIKDYDVVFVGFPIWWYVAPTIINTFLESYDFSGKTIVPFFTSGGSGAGKTDNMLHPSYPDNVKWKPAKQLNQMTSDAISEWVENLKL
jgi:flavodoxin